MGTSNEHEHDNGKRRLLLCLTDSPPWPLAGSSSLESTARHINHYHHSHPCFLWPIAGTLHTQVDAVLVSKVTEIVFAVELYTDVAFWMDMRWQFGSLGMPLWAAWMRWRTGRGRGKRGGGRRGGGGKEESSCSD